MCKVHAFGSIQDHRKDNHHKNLKTFLHPRCEPCKKDFPNREQWFKHRVSPEHIKKTVETDYKEPEDQMERFGMTLPRDSGKIVKKDGDLVAEETKQLSDANIEAYEMPEFENDKKYGTSFVKQVNGSFCKMCKKFLAGEAAYETHVKSKEHYEKFKTTVEAKKMKVATEVKPAIISKAVTLKRPILESPEENEDDTGNWKRQKKSNKDEDGDDDDDQENKDGDEKQEEKCEATVEIVQEVEEEGNSTTSQADQEEEEDKKDEELQQEEENDEVEVIEWIRWSSEPLFS